MINLKLTDEGSLGLDEYDFTQDIGDHVNVRLKWHEPYLKHFDEVKHLSTFKKDVDRLKPFQDKEEHRSRATWIIASMYALPIEISFFLERYIFTAEEDYSLIQPPVIIRAITDENGSKRLQIEAIFNIGSTELTNFLRDAWEDEIAPVMNGLKKPPTTNRPGKSQNLRHYKIFELREKGLSYKKIAAEMGGSEEEAKRIYSRLSKLRNEAIKS